MLFPRAKRIPFPRRRLTPLRILWDLVGLGLIMFFGYLAARPPHDPVMIAVACAFALLVGVDVIAGAIENNRPGPVFDAPSRDNLRKNSGG